MDYDRLREALVRDHIELAGISDRRVIEATRKVPRHEFVPECCRSESYVDEALPIGEGQTISQPTIVAMMTELLEIRPEHKVLEIGTGSGYQAAILAELAREVYTVERREALSFSAREVLARLGYTNIAFIVGDGSEGYAEQAPYDGIIVTAGCPRVPQPLLDQLAVGGTMVLPVGNHVHQRLTVVEKLEEGVRKREVTGCIFVPLVGKYAWE